MSDRNEMQDEALALLNLAHATAEFQRSPYSKVVFKFELTIKIAGYFA